MSDSQPRLLLLPDPALAVGELLAEAARRHETIALTGGSTPARAYEHAATTEVDWGKATLWWSDERCVPPGDPRSNFGLVRRTLLDRVHRMPTVHRIRGELAPLEAARAYDEALSGVTFDLLLLGLGSDGHIASLFPGSPQLTEETARATTATAALPPLVERVTLTLPVLRSARQIVFLVTGAEKAGAAARAFADLPEEGSPVGLLRAGGPPIDVYLDPAAAANL